MKIVVDGAQMRLRNSDFVASGGEGSIYVVGDDAYKIYHDKSRVLPEGKIVELQPLLSDPRIIGPRDSIKDGSGNVLGYRMKAVPDAYALCQIFPKAFRTREGVTPEQVLGLVKDLQEGVAGVHRNGVLIVDLNEMNFLVSKDFGKVYFIDVDSYQTRRYPATALMESVRDRLAGGKWTEGSDWFSFAVVSFQLFAGIHPYKGKHPTVKGMVARMDQNISVFDSSVRLPKVCYGLNAIPQAYRDWYRAVFVDKARCAPPSEAQAQVAVMQKQSAPVGLKYGNAWGSGKFVAFWGDLVQTDTGFYAPGRVCAHEPNVVGVLYRRADSYLVSLSLAGLSKGYESLVVVKAGTQERFEVKVSVDGVAYGDGELWVKSGSNILWYTGQSIVSGGMAPKVIAQVLPKASWLFRGGVMSDYLGVPYVTLLDSGLSYNVSLEGQIKGRVINACFDSGVLVMVVSDGGVYNRYVFRFDAARQNFDVRVVEDVVYSGIKMAVLDTGVCVLLNEEGQLELFSASKGSAGIKYVDDPSLDIDTQIFAKGGCLYATRSGSLCRLSLR